MSTTHPSIRELTFIGRTREAFFRKGDNAQEHKEQLDMLVDLKWNIASSSNQSKTIFHNFEEMSPGLCISFDKSIGQARSDNVNETFKYWDSHTCICLIQQVENFVRADRDGDWALHTCTQAAQAFFPSLQPLIPQII
jgi:hypothetical protein